MQSFFFLLVGIGLMALPEQAFAQDDGTRQPLTNPMYSPHNYKHPNLAAAARSRESRRGILVTPSRLAGAQRSNYKHQLPVTQPVGSLTVGHTPSVSLVERNYKIQRLGETNSGIDPKEYYMEQRKSNETASGN